ncbi:MAG: hypothetical protein ACLUPV_06660 [Bilophila wadsworthia]
MPTETLRRRGPPKAPRDPPGHRRAVRGWQMMCGSIALRRLGPFEQPSGSASGARGNGPPSGNRIGFCWKRKIRRLRLQRGRGCDPAGGACSRTSHRIIRQEILPWGNAAARMADVSTPSELPNRKRGPVGTDEEYGFGKSPCAQWPARRDPGHTVSLRP